jgi:hypothetical protein
LGAGFIAGCIGGLCAALALAQSLLVFETQALPFEHRNSPTSQKYLIETMGGGIALLDYDGDGKLDVFLVNGGKLANPSQANPDFARGQRDFMNRLYRQTAEGGFEDVTERAGLRDGPNVYGMGVATGDIDNDGDVDLYITGYGENTLYQNQGDGTFSRTGEARASGWSVSAAFLDFDNDGRLDLFVARYLDWSIATNILCGTPFYAYCRPDKFRGVGNLLYRNEGGGKFRDVSRETGISGLVGKGMGVAVNDYDADGFADIFVANDGMEQFLLHNEKGAGFREVGLEAGVALSGDARSYAGMGVGFADYDNDGRPDIVVTNLALEKYALYRNEGGGSFRYATLESGLAAQTARHSGWGVGLHDFDNDGNKDLFAAQGHVLDNVERIQAGLQYTEEPGLYWNRGGKFQAAGLGLSRVAGRGAAFGDINNDGRMDVAVSVLGGKPMILLNRTGAPGVMVRLRGTNSNRDGVGATLKTNGQTVYASTGGSYLSASDGRVHLAGKVERVQVRWPGGKVQTAVLGPGPVATITEKP